jgi:hypothetical protein
VGSVSMMGFRLCGCPTTPKVAAPPVAGEVGCPVAAAIGAGRLGGGVGDGLAGRVTDKTASLVGVFGFEVGAGISVTVGMGVSETDWQAGSREKRMRYRVFKRCCNLILE